MKRASAITVILPLIMGLVFGVSCQKDPDEPTKTRTELLTTGSWHLVSHTTNPPADLDGDGTADDTDVLVTYEECEKDDITSFSSNGTGTLDEGLSKCSTSDPQTSPFVWQWKNNETVISILGEDLTIVELSSSTLIATAIVVEGGVNYTQTITFQH